MISRFFIDRPIFAAVISILITLAGLAAVISLPIEQYPNITPPQILVATSYTGANAETIAETIAAPIEQQVNGVENMIYMYSQSSSSGAMNLNVFFEIGSDADMAQINTQNAVNLALPQLPLEVQQLGVTVQKQMPTILLIIAIQSPDGRYSDLYTSNYAEIFVVDELKRVKGMSNVSIIGARNYSMRVWLRPDRMAQLGFTAGDIIQKIKDQNALFSVGQIGAEPNSQPVELTVSVSTLGRLSDPEQFENIILRANEDGSLVRVKDIGRVELGAQDYSVRGELNGIPTTLIATYQMFGANALQVADEIKKTMERLSKNFPAGLEYSIPYDTTKFISSSIREVLKTIFEAAILVILVVFIFLQNLRATLIPLVAMIVSIVGTFAGMYLLGFSLNTLTLFGMVLAIGTVVDDAIVVAENVERNIRDFELSGREAAQKAMDEVTGPVIAIVFVLCAVFVPVAFTGGIAGQLYKQFAITIAISVVISGVVALTLSPALAALVLKPQHKQSRFSAWFNRHFDRMTHGYLKGVAWILHKTVLGLLSFAVILLFVALLFNVVPSSFVPSEDQGYLITVANMPDGASLERTSKVDRKVTEISLQEPGVARVVSLTGYSALDNLNRTTVGSNFVTLEDWHQRTSRALHSETILKKLWMKYQTIEEAQILPFNPPAIQGLGTVGGFEFWIESRGESNMQALAEVTKKFIEQASARPELTGLYSTIQANNLQLYANVDREKTQALGVPLSDVFQAMQSLLGSLFVNYFNKFGRVYQVIIQAEPSYRKTIDDIGDLYVRSEETKEMIPLKSLVNVKYSQGPALVSRFNGFTAAKINGGASAGYSSGQAMDAMEEVAREVLPEGMTFAWGGMSYQEKATGGKANYVLIAGMIMVFLILAALYEKWSLPFAILLAVPFGIFGALLSVWISGMSNDVYFQIGMVTLIALSAKNAILIVEFAVLKHEEGMSIFDAALEASKLRFRAILMTSLTFIFGVIPLVTSSGAGAASRQSVGVGVLGGMIAATVLAVFFVPLFFKLISRDKA